MIEEIIMSRIEKLENIKKEFELLLQEEYDSNTASVHSMVESLIAIERVRKLKNKGEIQNGK